MIFPSPHEDAEDGLLFWRKRYSTTEKLQQFYFELIGGEGWGAGRSLLLHQSKEKQSELNRDFGTTQKARSHSSFFFFFWFRGCFCSDGNTKNVASWKLKAPAERLQTSGADSAAVR